MSKPKLYQYAACPFCWKVRALLDYKKIAYETVEVHPINKKEIAFSEGYKKVPIYQDEEGKVTVDSSLIMRLIDSQHGSSVFTNDELSESKWLKWADGKLVRALPPLIYNNFSQSLRSFEYINSVTKFSWLQRIFVKYAGSIIMTLVARKSAKSQGITDPIRHLQALLTEFAKSLEGTSYLGGEDPNGADIAIFGILKSIETLPAFKDIQAQDVVAQWYWNVQSAIDAGQRSLVRV